MTKVVSAGTKTIVIPLITPGRLKGKIIFRVERSDELLDYLREKKQVII